MRARRLGWMLWLLAAACLCFFENNAGTRAVLLASLLAPLFSLACAVLSANRLSFSLRAPERARAGEAVSCSCVSAGDGWFGRRAGGTVRCVVEGAHLATGERFLLELYPRRAKGHTFTLRSDHCGCVTLRLVRTEIQDWFGLWAISRASDAEARTLIHPELYPVRIEIDSWEGASDASDASGQRRLLGPAGTEIRAWVPGDPVSRIHWKLTEKMDQPLVRESDPESGRGFLLLLETAAPDREDAGDMDEAVRNLFSLSRGLLALGEAHTVCWVDGPSRRLRRMEVTRAEDSEPFEDALLAGLARERGEGISAAFHLEYPEERFRGVLLCTPYPETSVIPLRNQPRITMILPRDVPALPSDSSLSVQNLSPENPFVSL